MYLKLVCCYRLGPCLFYQFHCRRKMKINLHSHGIVCNTLSFSSPKEDNSSAIFHQCLGLDLQQSQVLLYALVIHYIDDILILGPIDELQVFATPTHRLIGICASRKPPQRCTSLLDSENQVAWSHCPIYTL